MITTLNFKNGYPTRLKGIGKQTIRFNGWINILFGPNGSGKTTILQTLAAESGCGGGGWSEGGEPSHSLLFEACIVRDNQPVFYQDCYRDSESSFINAGFLEANAHLRSSGEKRMGLVHELIRYIENRFLSYKLPRETRPTLLLDEVDNHIGFAGQSILWNDVFPRLSKKYQLIISTHSIFPLLLRRTDKINADNLIVLEPQYAEVCVGELEKAIQVFNSRV